MKQIQQIQSEQSQIRNAMSEVRNRVQNVFYLDLPRGPVYDHPQSGFPVQDRIAPDGTSSEALTECYYSDFNSTEKSLLRWLSKWEKAAGVDALAPYAENLKALQADLEASKKELAETRAAIKEAKALKAAVKQGLLTGPLGECLKDFRPEYIARCLAVYDMPDGDGYEKEVVKYEGLYQNKICETVFVKKGSGEWERKQAQVIECANHSVDAYIYKLAEKIGKKVTAASIKGSLWDYSTLTVTCEGGEVQQWRTQCIINARYEYNTIFNQWPTRRID